MRKRIQAAVVPAVIVAAVARAAGYRAQDSRSRRRLDEPGDPNAVNRSSDAGRTSASTRCGPAVPAPRTGAAEQHQPDTRCASGPGQGRNVSHVHQW
jgi:hypothetical protein